MFVHLKYFNFEPGLQGMEILAYGLCYKARFSAEHINFVKYIYQIDFRFLQPLFSGKFLQMKWEMRKKEVEVYSEIREDVVS